MDIRINEHVYLAGLTAEVLVAIYSILASWSNSVLLSAAAAALLITVFGIFSPFLDDESLWRKCWMMFYLIPAALVAFGGVAADFEFKNEVLVSAGYDPIKGLIPGTSIEYREAVKMHYASLLIAPGSWIIALVVGIVEDVRRGET
jgi:hypothetical protein